MSKSQVAEIISLIVKPLIGEVCSQVRFSYGDELVLDFGELSNYNHPKLSYLQKGSWQLCTRATDWILTKENIGQISSFNAATNFDIAKEAIKQLKNKKLIEFSINYHSFYCCLTFDDNYHFILQCDYEDEIDLAYFELFMPEHKVLVFGPKLNWEFKSSLSKEY